MELEFSGKHLSTRVRSRLRFESSRGCNESISQIEHDGNISNSSFCLARLVCFDDLALWSDVDFWHAAPHADALFAAAAVSN